jgi:multidrug resistance efflux pump
MLALFAPAWRETVSGHFILEPGQRATVRASVPGEIIEVRADEGTPVSAGTPLFLLRNVRLETNASVSMVSLRTAEAIARDAQMNYTNIASAQAARSSQAGRSRAVFQQIAALQVASPIAGVVTSPRLLDRLGSFVREGDVLADVEDSRALKALIFVPEFQIQRIGIGAAASLRPEAFFQSIRGQVASIAPASSELASGLGQEEKYKGIAPPVYYVATVLIPNPGAIMRSGMSGEAKIEVRKRSVLGIVWETIREFLQRKIW